MTPIYKIPSVLSAYKYSLWPCKHTFISGMSGFVTIYRPWIILLIWIRACRITVVLLINIVQIIETSVLHKLAPESTLLSTVVVSVDLFTKLEPTLRPHKQIVEVQQNCYISFTFTLWIYCYICFLVFTFKTQQIVLVRLFDAVTKLVYICIRVCIHACAHI